MVQRHLVSALLVSAGLGAAVGLLAAVPVDRSSSVTGVTSEAGGSAGPEERKKGVVAPQENTIQGVTDVHGSIQSIRGIQGIDTVMLQNLEAVLRVQSRTEPPPRSNSSSAAALSASDETVEDNLQKVPDGREEHLEFELEGS